MEETCDFKLFQGCETAILTLLNDGKIKIPCAFVALLQTSAADEIDPGLTLFLVVCGA